MLLGMTHHSLAVHTYIFNCSMHFITWYKQRTSAQVWHIRTIRIEIQINGEDN